MAFRDDENQARARERRQLVAAREENARDSEIREAREARIRALYAGIEDRVEEERRREEAERERARVRLRSRVRLGAIPLAFSRMGTAVLLTCLSAAMCGILVLASH